jgi:uncharacterized membrane protein YbhN (UPF0104 family)
VVVIRVMWPWLRMLIGVGILAVLVWQLGTGAFEAALAVIDINAVLAALGIGLMTTVLSAWRWCLVARRLGLRLPLFKAVTDYYRALFLNAVLPTGVLGDVHRAVRHGQQVSDVGRGVRAVVLERAAGQVVVITAGLAVLLIRPAVVPAEYHGIVTATGAAIIAVAVAVLIGAVTAGERWAVSTSRWRRACATVLSDIRVGLLARDADAWLGVAVLSIAALAGYLTLFLVAARSAGVTAPVADVLPLVMFALLAMGLPVNIGGWGPREGAAALAFGAAGLGAEQGLTVAVVYGMLAMVASLPGAGVLAVRMVRGLSGRVPIRLRYRANARARVGMAEP